MKTKIDYASETTQVSVIAAVNTFGALYRLDIERNIYFNSPDTMFFDGSATGYWERMCLAMGVGADEIAQIKSDIEATKRTAAIGR